MMSILWDRASALSFPTGPVVRLSYLKNGYRLLYLFTCAASLRNKRPHQVDVDLKEFRQVDVNDLAALIPLGVLLKRLHSSSALAHDFMSMRFAYSTRGIVVLLIGLASHVYSTV